MSLIQIVKFREMKAGFKKRVIELESCFETGVFKTGFTVPLGNGQHTTAKGQQLILMHS